MVKNFLFNYHFLGIKTLTKYFNMGRSKFCIDCEKTYDREKAHTLKCVVRCSKCCRMGNLRHTIN